MEYLGTPKPTPPAMVLIACIGGCNAFSTRHPSPGLEPFRGRREPPHFVPHRQWSTSLRRAGTSCYDYHSMHQSLMHSASEIHPALAGNGLARPRFPHIDNRVTPASGAATSRCYTAGVTIEWRFQHQRISRPWPLTGFACDNRVTPVSGAATSRCHTAGVMIEWRLQHKKISVTAVTSITTLHPSR